MARIFITGSADGLGKMAAQLLVAEGHQVVLHARNQQRGKEALQGVPGATTVVTGNLFSIPETIQVAEQVNALGIFDAVIHNAAVGYREHKKIAGENGLSHVFLVNALAPYILTCLIQRPQRLVYISSGLHLQGDTSLNDMGGQRSPWDGYAAYANSKLYNVILAFAVARKWPSVLSNAIEPGWVATKMGGPGAPDSLEDAPKTQAWLATSQDPAAMVSGRYFYHMQPRRPLSATHDTDLQERFLQACAEYSGIAFPGA